MMVSEGRVPWVRTEWESRYRGRVMELRAQVWLGRDSWRYVVEVVEFREHLGAGSRTLAEGVVASREQAEQMAEDEARRWFHALPEHGWWP